MTTPTPTPCSTPECDTDGSGEPCDRHETEAAHAEGEHEFCDVTCEAKFPSEQLRNFIVAKGYPGTAGMLAELERRATVTAPTPEDAGLRQRIETALEECRTLIPAAQADALLPLVAADRAAILRIVSDWCIEANENGGVDAGDLAWRLEQAGYPLPDDEDEDEGAVHQDGQP